jgi:protein-disulfide isomerase
MHRQNVGWTVRAIGRALGVVIALILAAEAGEIPSQAEALLEALERGPGPSKGRPDAPVTIVEFSDFQCSFCRIFWRDRLPRIDEKYIQSGKVRFVFRHLALLGPPSVQAAVAAECAHEQGKFWLYHDRLFSVSGAFALSKGSLGRYADELKLDRAQFDTCLDTNRARQKIEQETIIGRMIGMTGTPGFLINRGRLIGAQPYEVFEDILDRMLQEVDQGRRQKP